MYLNQASDAEFYVIWYITCMDKDIIIESNMCKTYRRSSYRLVAPFHMIWGMSNQVYAFKEKEFKKKLFKNEATL